jgi:Zn finger protein HypA/HybF involved in hydrogenase expression
MGLGDWFKGIFRREEEIPEPMRSCDRCGFEFPEALMVTDGSQVFCSPCHGKRRQEAADAELRRRQALANMKVKYYCYDCKFHFARRKDFTINLCPNCGSGNFVEESRLL